MWVSNWKLKEMIKGSITSKLSFFLAQFHTGVNIRCVIFASCRIARDLTYSIAPLIQWNQNCGSRENKRIYKALTIHFLSISCFKICKNLSWWTWKLGEINVIYLSFIFHILIEIWSVLHVKSIITNLVWLPEVKQKYLASEKSSHLLKRSLLMFLRKANVTAETCKTWAKNN